MKRLVSLFLTIYLCLMLLPAVSAAEETPALSDEDKRALLAALYEADISSVREALSLRLISCEELTAYYLQRIEAYNEPYNCFITLCDNALEVARQRDEQLAAGEGTGALFGVPVVVKDNIHYAGYPTTNGRSSRLNEVSEENAVIVEYLLQEGAIILGKTNMSTDAQDARASRSSAAGETKNADNPYLASGGSSGGSAAAVSLNFAMAGLGTDTNSSLRYPAALNGCVSLRPTLGLLSKEGLIILNSHRDTPGAITRTVRDQAIMLDVISGGEYGYAENLDDGVLKGMRIGVLSEFVYPNPDVWQRSEEDLDDEIEAAFAAAVEELHRLGAEVVDVSLPNIFSLSSATFDGDSASARERYYAAYQALLRENDISAVIFPSYLHAPQWSGEDADGVYQDVYSQPYITNCRDLSSCIGIPEITVPIGQHSRGAGIGMEIAGDKNTEQLLLNIAYAYTQRYDHRAAPEGAENNYAADYAGAMAERIDAYYASLLPAEEVEPPAEEAVPDDTPPEEPSAEEEPPENEWSAVWLWLVPGVILVAFGAGAAVYYYNNKKHKRETEPVAANAEDLPDEPAEE